MVLPILEATKCDLCGTCVSACPTGALSISEERLVFSAPAECTYCATCEKVCPQQAIHCPLSIEWE
ncbi:MAG TPA: 4Fe-4S binding protein [Anaerolineaceae bacterium]|nr:4Fe-4S binding protein [Anaerolineaceae bacterium]